MKKILIILPDSIAGNLILRGFGSGFKSNGVFVKEIDFRDLKIEEIKNFKPDIIFGYDYGFLLSNDEELKNFIVNNQNNCKLVHYFADEPDSKLAYVDKKHLYEEFKKLNAASFLWDKDFLQQLPDSVYLPLAVNSKAYRIEPATQKYEISFVGRPLDDKRQRILAMLIKTFGRKLNIFCYERHFLQSLDDMKDKMLLTEDEMEIYKKSYKGFVSTEKELAAVYQGSKINLNITMQGESALNYRIFEVLASFGFLITDYVKDLEENFEVSKELESYKNTDDLIDKIEFYLKNPEISQRIAVHGYSKVIKKHTYTARADKLLRAIGFKDNITKH